VFSPYYAAARRRGVGAPMNHCAFNVVLSGSTRRWCMTERRRGDVEVAANVLRIGPSSLRWDGQGYEYQLLERGCPVPQTVRGTVRVQPLLQPGLQYPLDRGGHHLWTPLAPRARVEVSLRRPDLHWCGDAYLDSNRGDRALERDFSGWQWSRAVTAGGATVFYEAQHHREAPWPLALKFSGTETRAIALPATVGLPRSGWGIERQARSEDPRQTQLLHTMVDAPFYSRSLLRTQIEAESVVTVHESLNLKRFRRRWVQCLLPFRMPRHSAGQRYEPSPSGVG